MLLEILSWTDAEIERKGTCLGVVVSAIRPDFISRNLQRLSRFPLLVPGIGFQGGSLTEFAKVFNGQQDTMFVVARGVQGGLEKAVKFLMPVLFVILILLVGYSLQNGAFNKAVEFLFKPDFHALFYRLDEQGVEQEFHRFIKSTIL